MILTAAITPASSSKPTISSSGNLGVLQRFEVQQSGADELQAHESCCSTSQQLEIITDPSGEEAPSVRCPCCRSSPTKLICVNCLCTNVLRIGRVKEELRRLEQCKTAVCNLIETALVDEVKFESDFHQIRRSVDELKAKIAWKKDQVGRLRQRIANMDGQSQRSNRNVFLLKEKMVSHAARIERHRMKIENILVARRDKRIEWTEEFVQKFNILSQLFQLERRQLNPTGDQHIAAWTNNAKTQPATFLLNGSLCLDRANLLAQAFAPMLEQQQANPTETASSSSSSSSTLSRAEFPHESFGALAFAAQMAEGMALLLDCHLPYGRAGGGLHRGVMLLPASVAGPVEVMAIRQMLFRLDYAVLHLCLGHSVPPEQCELSEPLANLHALLVAIKAGKMCPCVPRVDQRLYRQIREQFAAVQPNGRVLNEFTLDSVENDWVKVHCAN